MVQVKDSMRPLNTVNNVLFFVFFLCIMFYFFFTVGKNPIIKEQGELAGI